MLEDMGPTMATDTVPAGVMVTNAMKATIGGTAEMHTQVETHMATAAIGGPAMTRKEERAGVLALAAADAVMSTAEVASSRYVRHHEEAAVAQAQMACWYLGARMPQWGA